MGAWKETSKDGTPCLQMFVQFKNKTVWGKPWTNKITDKTSKAKGATKFFSLEKLKANGTRNSASVLPAKGSLYENFMFCSKGEQTETERKGPKKNLPERGHGRNARLPACYPEGFVPKPGVNGRQGMKPKVEEPKVTATKDSILEGLTDTELLDAVKSRQLGSYVVEEMSDEELATITRARGVEPLIDAKRRQGDRSEVVHETRQTKKQKTIKPKAANRHCLSLATRRTDHAVGQTAVTQFFK